MNRYPIQLAKVQPPSLRDETLARDRLLDWLNAKIHDRVILVLADAGYGKTTLLADFARRTRLRTLWYRLEEDDRDWIAFLNHLVAAGREHDARFAEKTASMLSDMSMGGPTRDAAIDTFLRELPAIAAHGAVLILDDFHLVDDSADVRLVARELVARAPERMSIVFASRRLPTIPLAKLRAAGEVAELGTDDLRFDAEETGRLFSETYGRKLEADVLADVVARTEGWAASLQLVQAALRDRTPVEIRRFIRSLSGADQELYDYLAEEVVGDLPDDVQVFLMRTSILQTVTAELASVVAGLDSAETTRLTLAAERLTLLSRRSRNSLAPQRYHPLVREFLEARLRNADGEEAVTELHRRAAEAAIAIDWRIAAHHFSEAGEMDHVASVVAAAIPQIMGGGQYATAAAYVEQIPIEARPPGLNLVASRIDLQRGLFESAEVLSTEVLRKASPASSERDHALLNLMTIQFHAGRVDLALDLAQELGRTTGDESLRQIAAGMKLMMAASADGRIDELPVQLNAMAAQQRGSQPHYFGVTMVNLAVASLALDDPSSALDYARQAVEALEETSSFVEISAAVMAKASAMTMLGLGVDARSEIDRATGLGQVEAILEHAELADSFERPEIAASLLDRADSHSRLTLNDQLSLSMLWARFSARRGMNVEASVRAEEVHKAVGGSEIGQATARVITKAYVSVASQSPDGLRLAMEATQTAKRQGAERWYRVGRLLQASTGSGDELSSAIETIGPASPWNLTYVADIIARRLDDLSEAALSLVGAAARLHPGRWRSVLRTEVDQSAMGSGMAAARIVETIGEKPDVLRLRTYAKRQKRLGAATVLGRSLARRLADRVYVEDQGRVSIVIGSRHLPGSTVRRKVLALLCFLLTKPELASTRDQVLEALWPELDPLDAVNSLNQTVYFLRRILEEGYVDDLSPGYLHHDSDLLWLDRDLVSSRSHECRGLIKDLPSVPSPDQVATLADKYVGRFALDFEYEEWATPYRDWLHASYLEVMERSVSSDFASGHFARGIRLARRVLDIDPNAEQVEVSLLHLYRSSGAHAAAAEQYNHYAGVIREELGIEPPTLEAL